MHRIILEGPSVPLRPCQPDAKQRVFNRRRSTHFFDEETEHEQA
jgi:hypothetical protein